MKRSDPTYRSIAVIAREFTRRAYLMVSGGSGTMEAMHLGAWFADCEVAELAEAAGLLSRVPSYDPMST
jgi:hypothetical protein